MLGAISSLIRFLPNGVSIPVVQTCLLTVSRTILGADIFCAAKDSLYSKSNAPEFNLADGLKGLLTGSTFREKSNRSPLESLGDVAHDCAVTSIAKFAPITRIPLAAWQLTQGFIDFSKDDDKQVSINAIDKFINVLLILSGTPKIPTDIKKIPEGLRKVKRPHPTNPIISPQDNIAIYDHE